jgi:hypothetical protein
MSVEKNEGVTVYYRPGESSNNDGDYNYVFNDPSNLLELTDEEQKVFMKIGKHGQASVENMLVRRSVAIREHELRQSVNRAT